MSEKLLANNQKNRLSQLSLSVICISAFILASCTTTGEKKESISADSTKQVPIMSGSEVEVLNDPIAIKPLNTNGKIPFNPAKLDPKSKLKLPDDIDGYIVNQYWISSSTLSTEQLLALLKKYPKLIPIATRAGGQVMVEVVDETDVETVRELTQLEKETSIDGTYNHQVRGKNRAKGMYY